MIRNIQYLRGVAAGMVLLFHIAFWESRVAGGSSALPAWLRVGDAGVDLFFVISGFIMVHIQQARLDTPLTYRNFLTKRLTRIYPPYWIVTLCLIPLLILKPSLFNNYYENQVDLPASLLLTPQDYTPLLSVGWTLIHEVYFYVVVSMALIFNFRGRIIFGLAWATLATGGFYAINSQGLGEDTDSNLLKLACSPFSLTFLLGYFLGLSRDALRKCPAWFLGCLLVIGISALLIGSSFIPSVGVYPDNNHMFRLLLYGLPCSLLVASAVGLEHKLAHLQTCRPLMLLGDASYALYLVHLPIVAGFYVVVGLKGIREPIPLIASAVVCCLICLISAILFHLVIEKRLLQFFRSLIRIPPPVTPLER